MPDGNASIAMTQITSSAVAVYALQLLKRWKWFAEAIPHIRRAASVVLAFACSVGVQYAWNPTGRTITITLPTLAGAAIAVWHIVQHYAMQETIYQATLNRQVAPVAPPAAPRP